MKVQNSERFEWALGILKLKPNHKVLEIGCGVGLAVEMIAPKLKDGYIVAIDKSQPMIQKAIKRNGEFVKPNKAKFYRSELVDFSYDHAFDKVFCFNVNLFWTQKNISLESKTIKSILAKKGSLYLLFGPMFPGGYKKIVTNVKAALEREKFEVMETIFNKKIECCCFVAKPVKG